MIKSKMTLFIVLLLLSGCLTKVESLIKVGMEFNKAENILMNFGAIETNLQIIPEKSITGKYMNLNIYKLNKKPYILINYEYEKGIKIIKIISLYYVKKDSKKNSQNRTLMDFDKIDLNKL